MKRKKLTLSQHLKIAGELRLAARLIEDTYFHLQEYYPPSSKIMSSLWRVTPHLDGPWSKVKSELDRDYHLVITDEQFGELGHVYYSNKIIDDVVGTEIINQKWEKTMNQSLSHQKVENLVNELQDKINELQSELPIANDVLKQHVLILEDLEKLTGVSTETLKNDISKVFGNVVVKCGSCGELVASERQICPYCMYFVDEREVTIHQS